MDEIIRPIVVLAVGPSIPIQAIDSSTPVGERLAREFEQAPAAEDIVAIVWEAIDYRVPLFSGGTWWTFNAAHVVTVKCESFDG